MPNSTNIPGTPVKKNKKKNRKKNNKDITIETNDIEPIVVNNLLSLPTPTVHKEDIKEISTSDIKNEETITNNDKNTECTTENVSQDTSNADVCTELTNSDIDASTFSHISKKFDPITILWFSIIGLILISLLISIIVFFTYTYKSMHSNTFVKGVSIHGIDVSNMTYDDAKDLVEGYIIDNTPKHLTLVHGDFETSILTGSLEISYDVDKSLDEAFTYGKSNSFFGNGLDLCYAYFKVQDFSIDTVFNREILFDSIEDISSKLPTAVVESSCYIEGNELLLYPGSPGDVVNSKSMFAIIENGIIDVTLPSDSIQILTLIEDPTVINIEHVYSQVYSDPQNATYTKEPYEFTPSKTGIDFTISLDEAKEMMEQPKTEYVIPLKVLQPKIDNSDIGMDAFPNKLGTFTTTYNQYDYDRTTNVRLSSEKINGYVLMPGETFSYNNVVGARTIEAGYKEAPMYLNGEVVTGLGGGICQTTSTLYNAAIYANLEIVTRSNHTFVPSYASASRDATVVYGVIDFEFKNNRDYPIKIKSSVSGGKATVSIYGLKTDDDYDVEISSYQTGSNSTHIYSSCYKILKKNGNLVEKVLMSKDVYKKY